MIKRKENIFGISSHACVHVTLLLQEGASTFSSTKISTQAFLGYIIFQPSWGSNIGWYNKGSNADNLNTINSTCIINILDLVISHLKSVKIRVKKLYVWVLKAWHIYNWMCLIFDSSNSNHGSSICRRILINFSNSNQQIVILLPLYYNKKQMQQYRKYPSLM